MLFMSIPPSEISALYFGSCNLYSRYGAASLTPFIFLTESIKSLVSIIVLTPSATRDPLESSLLQLTQQDVFVGIYTMKWVPVPFSIPNELFSLVRATDSDSRIKTVEIIYPLILAIVLAECLRSSLIKYFTFKIQLLSIKYTMHSVLLRNTGKFSLFLTYPVYNDMIF